MTIFTSALARFASGCLAGAAKGARTALGISLGIAASGCALPCALPRALPGSRPVWDFSISINPAVQPARGVSPHCA